MGGSVPPSLRAETEKPLHFSYLREFRVEPCPLFKQHQCHQHRPYTCFHWHFANQRRRRPVRRRDATFNYSPDIYCVRYDENSGLCPDGDACPFLHRVAGDVERKYHLRYYKTALCVHPTDAKGHCLKNGAHCAFAHSPEDLRLPIFDVREMGEGRGAAEHMDHKDRTSFVVEDPVWQEQAHVLACYKTQPCKKPPRLCRQGYACPFFHNGKDRRRPPGLHKYRSTPCPQAKAADEWADADACDQGEACGYCHSRTEQQFHPEIYKSSKCNDMLQHGYCPRGPFCAFAHTDQELHADRSDVKRPEDCKPFPDPAAQPVPTLLPAAPTNLDIPEAPIPPHGIVRSASEEAGPGASALGLSLSPLGPAPTTYSTVLKQRSGSVSHVGGPSSLPKAPGYEREHQQSPTRIWTPEVGGPPQSRVRTTSLNFNPGTDMGTPPNSSAVKTAFYSQPKPLWPASTPSDSSRDMIGSAGAGPLGSLIEDLSLEDPLNPMELSEGSSAPVSIPGAGNNLGLFPSSSGGSGGPFRMSGSFGGGSWGEGRAEAPRVVEAGRPLASSATGSGGGSVGGSVGGPVVGPTAEGVPEELVRAREELASHRTKVSAWEEGLKQARQACEAWKREAEGHRRRAAQAEAERTAAQAERAQLAQERDAALHQLALLRQQLRPGPLSPGQPQPLGALPSPALCARCGRQASQPPNPSCPLCRPNSKHQHPNGLT